MTTTAWAPRPLSALQIAVALDDAGEDLGATASDRITCHPCQSWADHAHDPLTGARLTTAAAEARFPGSTTAYRQEWPAPELLDAYHTHPCRYAYLDPTDLPVVADPAHLDASVGVVDTARAAHHARTGPASDHPASDHPATDGPDLTDHPATDGPDLTDHLDLTDDLGL